MRFFRLYGCLRVWWTLFEVALACSYLNVEDFKCVSRKSSVLYGKSDVIFGTELFDLEIKHEEKRLKILLLIFELVSRYYIGIVNKNHHKQITCKHTLPQNIHRCLKKNLQIEKCSIKWTSAQVAQEDFFFLTYGQSNNAVDWQNLRPFNKQSLRLKKKKSKTRCKH